MTATYGTSFSSSALSLPFLSLSPASISFAATAWGSTLTCSTRDGGESHPQHTANPPTTATPIESKSRIDGVYSLNRFFLNRLPTDVVKPLSTPSG